MAGSNFNIPQLFQQYFGLQGTNAIGQAFSIVDSVESLTGSAIYDPFTSNPSSQQFSGLTTLPNPISVATSVAGVPIYEQFTFTLQENGVTTLDYTFPGWPLMGLEFPNVMTKTPVTAQPGTVKDFIGEDDVAITIRGLLINHDTYDIPLADMVALRTACRTNKSLKVTSRVLNALDIHYLVIDRLQFLEVEGSMQVQPFYIEAVSDYPYELIIYDAVKANTLTPQQQARNTQLGS